jgi:small subunit ribosomal protein S2
MEPYIFGERNKIHIINLDKTVPLFNEAVKFVERLAARPGRKILFVGTKRSAQETIAREAARCNMPYVSRRWLGGMLTNFKTVKQSVRRLKDLEEQIASGALEFLSKKEGLTLKREATKLDLSIGGIKDMDSLPDAIFIVDVGHERIAVAEANKLGIPIVGIVDTNNSPDGVDYIIPGNDDAIRSVGLYTTAIADAVLSGSPEVIDDAKASDDEFVEIAAASPNVENISVEIDASATEAAEVSEPQLSPEEVRESVQEAAASPSTEDEAKDSDS